MNALKAALIQAVLHFCSVLPLAIARKLGSLAVALYWPLNGRSRRVTERNIELAFPELDGDAQKRLAKDSLCATGELAAEMGHVWLKPLPYVRGLIHDVTGGEDIARAQSDGRGVIVLAPHIGNWEMIGLHLPTFGNTVSLYEPPKISQLGPLVEASRQRSGATLVPTDARGLAKLLRSVRRGDISGILPDQAPGDLASGLNSPFMGIPCFTATLAPNMVRRTGALAVFGFAKRVSGGFTLHYFPAEEALYSESDEEALAALNRGVERCVRECVEQYQWEYKRFRIRPKDGPGLYDDL